MKSILTEMMLAISNSFAASILFKVTLTSTLTLVAARLARRSRASVRHVLVAAAFALLFVLPIASVLVPPVHIPLLVTGREVVAAASISETLLEFPREAGPEPSATAAASIPRLPRMSLPALLFGGWVLGIILFLGPVAAGLWQTRRLRRSSLPWRDGQPIVDRLANEAGIRRPVNVLLHESAPGPMTCGVLQPAIVLPVDAKTWPRQELSSAIIHELEHVRRGDWITRCLARAVCAAYWFHPMVWILWRQFVLEAERACDDAVLRRSEATTYADQLVVLAQRLLASPEPPMLAMANRYDLARRVTALLDTRQRRGRAGAIWIGLTFLAAALLVTTISPLHIVAGSQAGPKFEVASIKPCKEEDFASNGQRRQEIVVSPDRIVIQCRPLDRIIYFAYAGVGNMEHPLLNNHPSNPDLIRGGPGWVHTDTFVIEAKAEGISDRAVMMGPMLRALLEERFQLKTHRFLEEAPLYELTVAKGGLKMKAMKEGECVKGDSLNNLSPEERRNVLASGKSFVCGSFTAVGNGVNRTFSLGGETMTRFANQVLSSVLDRYVVDKTDIHGEFNIHLEFGMDESIQQGVFGGRPPGPLQEPPPGVIRGPSIFTALEEQLGLKLEKTKGTREYLAIDNAARPAGF